MNSVAWNQTAFLPIKYRMMTDNDIFFVFFCGGGPINEQSWTAIHRDALDNIDPNTKVWGSSVLCSFLLCALVNFLRISYLNDYLKKYSSKRSQEPYFSIHRVQTQMREAAQNASALGLKQL